VNNARFDRRCLALAFLLVLGSCRANLAEESEQKQSSARQSAEPGPVKQIIDGMKDSQSRLKRGESDAETRAVQERVVNGLQKLIDRAKQNNSGGGQNNSSPRQDRSQQSPSQSGQSGQNPSSSGAPNPSSGTKGGGKPGGTKPPASEKNLAARTRPPLLHEVWGHLPPALRERMRDADFGETILPAYDDLVRRYFEALLEESSPRGRQYPPPAGAQP